MLHLVQVKYPAPRIPCSLRFRDGYLPKMIAYDVI